MQMQIWVYNVMTIFAHFGQNTAYCYDYHILFSMVICFPNFGQKPYTEPDTIYTV